MAAILTAGSRPVVEARLSVESKEQQTVQQQFCDTLLVRGLERKLRLLEGLRPQGSLLHAFNRPYD